LSLYRQWLHLFHFPYSWEVSGPSGGCGVSVFNNYRPLMWWLFSTIDDFLFLNHAKSGCTVTRRTFSHSRLTIRQDALSHHALMWQDALSKRTSRIGGGLCMTFLGTAPTTEHYKLGGWSTSLPVWRPGDCTDHRALQTRGLVDQSTSLETWRLHRPLSTTNSGTGRPVYQFGDLGTAPTNLSTICSGTGRPVY